MKISGFLLHTMKGMKITANEEPTDRMRVHGTINSTYVGVVGHSDWWKRWIGSCAHEKKKAGIDSDCGFHLATSFFEIGWVGR